MFIYSGRYTKSNRCNNDIDGCIFDNDERTRMLHFVVFLLPACIPLLPIIPYSLTLFFGILSRLLPPLLLHRLRFIVFLFEFCCVSSSASADVLDDDDISLRLFLSHESMSLTICW